MFKKYKFFVFLLGVFLIFPSNISAMVYRQDTNFCYDDEDRTKIYEHNWWMPATYGSCTSKFGDSYRAYYSVVEKDTGTKVYCLEQDVWDYTYIAEKQESTNFVKSDSWKNLNCDYEVNGDRYYNGKCSQLLGFVIDEANSQTSGSDLLKYEYAQNSIWMFLSLYAPRGSRYATLNDKYDVWGKTWRKDVKIFRKIIDEAMRRYHNSNKGNNVSDIKFSISYADSNLYYSPNDSCDSENYISRNIAITNNDEYSKLSFAFLGVPSGVSFKIDGSPVSNQFSIDKGSSKTLIVSYSGNEDAIKFDIKVDRENPVEKSNEFFDTNMFYASGAEDIYQKMMMIDKSSKNNKAVENSKTVTLEFSKKKVVHSKCESGDALKSKFYSSGKSNVYTYGDNVNDKYCASDESVGGSLSSSKDKFEAYFVGCNCKMIDVGSGKVGIRLYENAGFRYGELTTNVVRNGMGFGFKTKDGNLNIDTTYLSKISWEYADTLNGNPYYYNASNPIDSDASRFEETITKAIIRDYLKNIQNVVGNAANVNLKIPIKTKYSNSNDADVTFNMNYNIKCSQTGNKEITCLPSAKDVGVDNIKGESLEIPHAYFKVDGEIAYDANQMTDINPSFAIYDPTVHLRDGDFNYYVPIDYNKGNDLKKFPFDISDANLSMLKNSSFKLSATCKINVPGGGGDGSCLPEDCPKDDEFIYDAVRYRSIDHQVPFPKAYKSDNKDLMPDNWKEYWKTSKINRLFDSFTEYEKSNPLYSITIDQETMKKLGSINRNYSSWSGITEDGVSKFVDENFRIKSSSNSYCKIGEFSDACDKLPS